jgi:hypothetical protein
MIFSLKKGDVRKFLSCQLICERKKKSREGKTRSDWLPTGLGRKEGRNRNCVAQMEG